MKFKAIIHKADKRGYWAEVPAIPECVTQPATKEALRRNLREAVSCYHDAGDHGIVAEGRPKNAGRATYSIDEARSQLGLAPQRK